MIATHIAYKLGFVQQLEVTSWEARFLLDGTSIAGFSVKKSAGRMLS